MSLERLFLRQVDWSASNFLIQVTKNLIIFSSHAVIHQSWQRALPADPKWKMFHDYICSVWNCLFVGVNLTQMLTNSVPTYDLLEQLWHFRTQDHVVIISVWLGLKSHLLDCACAWLKASTSEFPRLSASEMIHSGVNIRLRMLQLLQTACLFFERKTSLSSTAGSQTDPITLWMYHS